MTSSVEVPEPSTFVATAPLVFNRLWNRLAALSTSVVNAGDPTVPLQLAPAKRSNWICAAPPTKPA
jgi:type VI secretion system protein ImpM